MRTSDCAHYCLNLIVLLQGLKYILCNFKQTIRLVDCLKTVQLLCIYVVLVVIVDSACFTRSCPLLG